MIEVIFDIKLSCFSIGPQWFTHSYGLRRIKEFIIKQKNVVIHHVVIHLQQEIEAHFSVLCSPCEFCLIYWNLLKPIFNQFFLNWTAWLFNGRRRLWEGPPENPRRLAGLHRLRRVCLPGQQAPPHKPDQSFLWAGVQLLFSSLLITFYMLK